VPEQVEAPREAQRIEGAALCVCYGHKPAILDRPAVWIPVIVVMLVSFFVLVAMSYFPYGIPFGTLIPYTAFVALDTFSAQRGMQPYFFECPIVRQMMPRLLWRHFAFLAGVIFLETIALRLTRYMPASWVRAGKNSSPFAIALCAICICIACFQGFTNRTLLERAHGRKISRKITSYLCEG
jgi:hypothetical protein